MRSDDEHGLFDDEDASSDEAVPATGGVRITGATPVGDDPLADWSLDDAPAATELPPWTDAPTGQVPAVLSRDDEDAEPAIPSPTWREETSDWDADEALFDAGLLSEEDPQGALNPTPVLEESQPWEFDLDRTQAIPVVGPAAQPEPEQPADPDVAADLVAGSSIEGAIPVTGAPPAEVAPRRRRGRQPRRAPVAPVDEDQTESPAASSEPAEPAEAPADRPRRISSRVDVSARTPRPPQEPTVEPDGGGRDMLWAVVTGVIIALLVVFALDLGNVLTMVLVMVVVTLAAAEAFAAFRRGGYHPATLLGLVAILALLVATYNRGTQALGLVSVLLFVFTILWFMVGVERADVLKGTASTVLVYVWIGVFGSYAALLLNPTLFPDRHGLAFLLAAIVVAVIYDIAALFIGSSIGRRPLAPSISPNKTWEGLLGASAAAILVGVIVVPLVHPWTLASGFALGVTVAIVAPLGDLTESLIKRHLNIKDMGRLLPGHGGMLDRVDGLIFVLPATFYLVRAFNLG